MATETTVVDNAPSEDPREVRQERRVGTIDLDGTGAGSITVALTGELHALGTGLMSNASVSDGSVSVSNLTVDSVGLTVSGGTADATVDFEVVVSEDGFYRESGGI
jgi:hypothetical protein